MPILYLYYAVKQIKMNKLLPVSWTGPLSYENMLVAISISVHMRKIATPLLMELDSARMIFTSSSVEFQGLHYAIGAFLSHFSCPFLLCKTVSFSPTTIFLHTIRKMISSTQFSQHPCLVSSMERFFFPSAHSYRFIT